MSRELMSCEDCVFCIDVINGWDDYSYICNLGLDNIFHERNDTDIGYISFGCKNINPNPTIPCKARYTDEEMRKLLGV